MSQAGKECKGKSGVEKTNCLAKFKQKAQAEKIKTMKAAMAKCSKTKDPATCKNKIQLAISKEKSKMGAS